MLDVVLGCVHDVSATGAPSTRHDDSRSRWLVRILTLALTRRAPLIHHFSLSPLNVLSHAFTDPSWCCETLTVHHNKAHRMSDRKRHCVGATAKDHPVARSTYPFWVGYFSNLRFPQCENLHHQFFFICNKFPLSHGQI